MSVSAGDPQTEPKKGPLAGGSDETPAFLLAGGRPRNEESMSQMLSKAFGRTPNPRVAYIGTANGDNAAFFAMMKLMLNRAGAKKVDFARIAREKADVVKVKSMLEAADVIFLSGGEVEDGINWLKKHSLISFLHTLYENGKQYVGVSAGSIMLGSHWVRWDDENDDNTASLFDCLGIVPLVFDTHAEDEDWKELKTALKLMGDGAQGYGIPSGGMISADHSGNIKNIVKELLVFTNDNGDVRRYNL